MGNVWSETSKHYNLFKSFNRKDKEAYLYEKLQNGNVTCKLCPRNCNISHGNVGFCKVRKNIDGSLYAQSYGKATHMTIEKVETEAVFHFLPGSNILSLGNFGCNLDCDYCQNWMFSQFQYTSPDLIHDYTSEQIIDYAIKNNIKILSWTYNDPAVWFEFAFDTAKLAKEKGIISLFKSAHFLSEEAIKMLIEVMDVFAVSIKAIDKDYYKKFTKGWLDPVLNCAKIIYESGKHLEISNLVVTGLTNNDDNYQKMIDFVKYELDENIPLHFTRFHPDYKYTHVGRTPVEDVFRARELAIKNGLTNVYLGNVFENEGLNTFCKSCGQKLIQRYGLQSTILDSLDDNGYCRICGTNNQIILNLPSINNKKVKNIS